MMSSPKVSEEQAFKGLPVNSGKALAEACLYSAEFHKPSVQWNTVDARGVAAELKRFEKARTACVEDLDKVHREAVRTIGKAEAEIFLVQKHILNDPAIAKAITQSIRTDRKNLQWAISDVFDEYEKRFASIDDEYLRERASDLSEVRQRLFDHLRDTSPGFRCEGQAHCRRGEDKIIVARTLTAQMMVHMNLRRVRGIVTEHGGVASHAAIIARSVGVPAVTGVRGVFDVVACGTEVLVDGDEGQVIVWPDKKTVAKLMPAEMAAWDKVCVLKSPAGTEVMANASMTDDVQEAVTVRADGIGLFRTEIEFMRQERLLGEEEQYEYYRGIAVLMGDRPVTFRLLDVGGDKDLPFLGLEKEANPYLGLRGARFLLENPAILSAQVKAMLRVSRERRLRILFPMVIDAAQLDRLVGAVRELMPTVDARAENVTLGAMFEVPSACLAADEILSQCDFASIGSNDLIQYLFAVDRSNEMVSRDYNPEHPLLWDLLRQLSEAARRAGKPLSICGEMAGRIGIPTRLIGIGITSMSVSPRLVSRVRTEIASSGE